MADMESWLENIKDNVSIHEYKVNVNLLRFLEIVDTENIEIANRLYNKIASKQKGDVNSETESMSSKDSRSKLIGKQININMNLDDNIEEIPNEVKEYNTGTRNRVITGERIIAELSDLITLDLDKQLYQLFALFTHVDDKGKDVINYKDIGDILTVTISHSENNPIELSHKLLDTVVLMIMEKVEDQKDIVLEDKSIEYSEFSRILNLEFPEILNNMNLSPAHWLKRNLIVQIVQPEIIRKPNTTKEACRFSPFDKALAIDRKRRQRMSDKNRKKEFEHKKNNHLEYKSKIIFTVVYILLNVGLFLFNAYRYMHINYYIMVARGFGLCLNVNCILVIVPILRHSISWMSSKWIAQYLPLSNGVFYHKVIGIIILIQSIGHTIPHLINLYFAVGSNNEAFDSTNTTQLNTNVNTTTVKLNYWLCLLWNQHSIGWVFGGGWAFPTGVWALLILIIISLFALPIIRRSGYFQLFYWTHALSSIFWFVVILHSPHFWKYFIIPGVIYIIEKLFRTSIFRRWKYGKLFIIEANLFPSKVTHLVIQRPQNFKYKAGDYIFVKIPSIANYEWHPFTISSSPELQDELWLHVRSLGDWTKSLYEYCSNIPSNYNVSNKFEDSKLRRRSIASTHYRRIRKSIQENTNQAFVDKTASTSSDVTSSIKNRAIVELGQQQRKPSILKFSKDTDIQSLSKYVKIPVQIDGPYSTAAAGILDRTQHAVLVAGGIGVTPFASILQSFMFRHLSTRHVCTKCTNVWYDKHTDHILKVKKVDFIWVNRDQKSFEWFVNLLAQLEMLQSEQCEGGSRALDIHIYMTAARNSDDLRPLTLQLALESIQRRTSLIPRDINETADRKPQLKTMIRAGRPDFSKIFEDINKNRKGQVKVYACGPPLMCGQVKKASSQHGFDFLKEHF